ncbi:hypothetical protein [Bacillus manliponensis]|uniref:hypothetical protein n=1 Tax=Bacillus manliponensis TaxID=574376 RepID=UPI00055450B7|nr:hypothetical protein [Bacillus manliponensis]
MCACNGTGIIQNDIGMGMYEISNCICSNAKGMSNEEWKQRRQDFANWIDHAEQLHKEGKWDGETFNTFTSGKQYNRSTESKVHEAFAS